MLASKKPGQTTDASLLVSGTLADARLSANVALENVANVFTAKQSFSGVDHVGLCLNSLTTAEYNALTPANGDLFRDSTTDRIDARLSRGTVELVDTAGGQTINGNLAATTLMVGGASGPLLRNNGGTIGARTNNNGADAPLTCSNLTASGTVMLGGSTGPFLRNNGSATVEVMQNNGASYANLTVGACRTNTIQRDVGDVSLTLYNSNMSVANFCIRGPSGAYLNSSGVAGTLLLNPTVNQTGTAGSTDLLINRTETALGSGAHNFVDFQRNSVSRLSISNFGTITTTGTIVFPGTAITKQITFGDVYNDGSSLQFLNGATAIATFNAATGISTGLGITASGTVTAQTALKIGTTVSAAPGLFPFTGATHTTPNTAGRGVALYSYVNAAESTSIAISGDSSAQTTGTNVHLLVQRVFTPTSGTGTYYFTELRPTVNQTGGANGITRGLFINPTLTAAADFRAIDVGNCGSHTAIRTGTGLVSFGDSVTITGTTRLGTYTVGTLPSASANTRARAFVTDSNLAFNSANLGATVTAGGSTLVPVFSNGTNWVIG